MQRVRRLWRRVAALEEVVKDSGANDMASDMQAVCPHQSLISHVLLGLILSGCAAGNGESG